MDEVRVGPCLAGERASFIGLQHVALARFRRHELPTPLPRGDSIEPHDMRTPERPTSEAGWSPGEPACTHLVWTDLVLEDLHWSDYSTLDLIAWLAQRREPARRRRLGTYRPVEVIVRGHALRTVKQELDLHRQCEELLLDELS